MSTLDVTLREFTKIKMSRGLKDKIVCLHIHDRHGGSHEILKGGKFRDLNASLKKELLDSKIECYFAQGYFGGGGQEFNVWVDYVADSVKVRTVVEVVTPQGHKRKTVIKKGTLDL